jgi:hypothetical protein
MNVLGSLRVIGGACIGAGIMYFADPRLGKRRRSLVRDQFVRAGAKTRRFVQGRGEDVKNRLYGLYCETRELIGSRCESSRGEDRTGMSELRANRR